MRMQRVAALSVVCTGLICFPRDASAQITAGHVDDFQQGSTAGWREGSPSPNQPQVVPDGGPEGVGDAFLRNVSSGTFGQGGRMAMFNLDQHWQGNYLNAQLAAIEADLNNLGNQPLTMRFLLQGGGGNVFTSGFDLPPQSGWQRASFSLAIDDLHSSGDVVATLGDVGQLWLIHNSSPSHPPPPVNAVLGVDNITAVAQILLGINGDYNHSGVVEQGDLDLVLLNWGGPADPPPEGWINDLPVGQIDQDELDGVLLNWGATAMPVEAASVPEPRAWTLMVIATLAALIPGWRFAMRRSAAPMT